MANSLRPLRWMGSSQDDLRHFPNEAKRIVGFALFEAQEGRKHHSVKPLLGFGGASVLEVIANDDGDTYRAVYTVRFNEATYVLHAFQKKSKSGAKTPQQELDLVRRRVKAAAVEHRAWRKE